MTSTLEDRLADFICGTARLMGVPKEHMEYFADEVVSNVKEMLPHSAYSRDTFGNFIKLFSETIQGARQYLNKYSNEEFREELPVFAAIMAGIFLVREGALKDPLMKDAVLAGRKTCH